MTVNEESGPSDEEVMIGFILMYIIGIFFVRKICIQYILFYSFFASKSIIFIFLVFSMYNIHINKSCDNISWCIVKQTKKRKIMAHELQIKLFSYDTSLLDSSVRKIVDIAKTSNCTIKGPIPLPTKREVFTICRSPHVDKPSMEQFERRTHKRLIMLANTSAATIDSLRRLVIPSGVEIQIK
jgi:small subunit ribosomal protein S10